MISAAALSVVLCTRDGRSKGYLDAAVRSVLEQSIPPAEVIVVDDGSTDGTPEYVRSTYPQVRVVANARTGLAAGRNTGVAAARGRWIAFMDDDDVWRQEKLAGQFAQIAGSDRPEKTIWASRMVWIDGAGRIASPPVALDHLARWPACFLGSPVVPSGAIVARALLDQVGAFAEHLRVGSAYDYWLRCLAGGAAIRFSDAVLLEHRRRHGQMSGIDGTLELMLAVDEMTLPHLQRLSSAQADRVRTVRLLAGCQSALVHTGPRSAVSYWRRTPLRRGRMDWRAAVYLLLDTAARPLPPRFEARMRDFAARTMA